MKFIGIIPARYASTRFPGKPLAMIGGLTMIERVYRQACKELDDVLVATDSDLIYDAVKGFGGNVVMTSDQHKSGTDRCFEAYRRSGSDADVVINIQGDEPFIAPEQIAGVKGLFDDGDTEIGTLVRAFDKSSGYDVLANPNTPKVVLGEDMRCLYFSRSVIPYLRGVDREEWPSRHNYFTHVGMYAYRVDVLAEIVKLPQSSLELAESLEQLRWLQNGYVVRAAITDKPTIGIDTPDDLEAARKYVEIC